MAVSKKQMHELKSALKRRERRPETTYVAPQSLSLTRRERDRVTQSNAGMLLGIETVIVENCGEFPELDDCDVERALVAVIRNRDIVDETPVAILVQKLMNLGVHWSELDESEEDWSLALRAILDSVKTRSSGQKGSRNYLAYAINFIADANARQQAKFR